MTKTAIILGATGLTGGLLLEKLLKDVRYQHIILFGRHSCGKEHPKLTEHIIDMFEIKEHADLFKADEVFCCIGTTKAKTSDKTRYRKIDFGIPVDAASLCKENTIPSYTVISALGADKNSSVFYNKVKGEMEAAVLDFNLPQTYLLQPSLIAGDREESRLGESVMNAVLTVTKPLLSLFGLKKYQPIDPAIIAECMIRINNSTYPSGRIESDTIQQLGSNDS